MDFPSNKGITNRSMPASTVTPVLAYADVGQAADWLCRVFGFIERLRIGTHRAQLEFFGGSVVVCDLPADQERDSLNEASEATHSVMVRVEDAERHYQHTREGGAQILLPLTDYPFGERQYTVKDPGGHIWTFSQSLADVDPSTWGASVTGNE